MPNLIIVLFWVVVFLIMIPWLVKLMTGRREEAVYEIIFLLIGLIILWFVGGAIAIIGGQLEVIFQTRFAGVQLSETQKQLIQGAALILATVMILNLEKILAKLNGCFSKLIAWIRRN